jgi:hypothetical protein
VRPITERSKERSPEALCLKDTDASTRDRDTEDAILERELYGAFTKFIQIVGELRPKAAAQENAQGLPKLIFPFRGRCNV